MSLFSGYTLEELCALRRKIQDALCDQLVTGQSISLPELTVTKVSSADLRSYLVAINDEIARRASSNTQSTRIFKARFV